MNKEKIVIDFAYLTMCAENDYIYETGEAKALLDYITNLQQQNKELHNKIDKYKSLEQSLTFIKNRAKQGMTQENINKCAIQLVNNYLKDSDVDD